MRASGYKTFFIGKWHLGKEGSYPEDHGFEINVGGWESGSPKGGYFSPWTNPSLENKQDGENLSMRLARETVGFMKENKDAAFFAFLSFYAVHAPIQTTQEKWNKYREKIARNGIADKGYKMERVLPIRQVQDNPVYAGLVESTDDAVGVVLDALEDLGLEENTIVIFTSDNGGVASGDNFSTSNLPLRGGKGYQWEGGIREPYFIKVPWLKAEARQSDYPVTGTDFYPTILEFANIDLLPEQHVDGVSLKPLLENSAFEMPDRALFWHYPHYGNQGGEPSSIIRDNDWKLIHYWEDGRNELYNLKSDPFEQSDLAGKNPQIAGQLASKLISWLTEVNAELPDKDPDYDPEKARKRHDMIVNELMPKLEQQRKDILSAEFRPNDDWWGSKVTLGEVTYKNSAASIEARVDDLLARMTIEEKVSQMRMFHQNQGIDFSEKGEMELSDNVKQRLVNGIGGIKNPGEYLSPENAASLNNQLQKYVIEKNSLGIPAFFVTESYNGVDAQGSTRFPRPITLSSSWNRELIKDVYDAVGREARLRGLHLTHSPVADIARDPRFGRMSEGFGEDTYLTTEMIVSAVSGLQGDYEGLKSTHIGAVTKHFAAYGQVAGGTNFASIEISPRTLIDEIFPPFKAAVQRANSLGIMASHGDINGVASHANPWLLTQVLRDQWGFEGYTVSDANDIARLHSFMKVAETPEEAVILGLKAGMDVDLYSDDAYALLPEMVKKDPQLEAFIDRSARRVLRTKFILGLFDNPYQDPQLARQEVRNDASRQLAHETDLESIILLKNDKQTLPLTKGSQKTIALVGPLFDEETLSNFELVAGDDYEFVAEKGFALTDGDRSIPQITPIEVMEEGIRKIVSKTINADAIILFLGGDEFTSKEAFFGSALGDRDSIDPVGLQDELLLELKKTGKPVVVVLKHRRTLSINAIDKHADAILDCWELSEFGDRAIAKMIFGQATPSGKLPVTVPRSIGQIPFHYSQKEISYKKGYLFAESTPLYPFGYGLSYTNFEYSKLQLSDTKLTRNGTIIARIEVKNSGQTTGSEVVQLYVKDVIGSVLRPDKELKGFEKVSLKPGESKTVSFTIAPDMLVFTGLEMEEVVEAGEYIIMVGGSSNDLSKKAFRLVLSG
jgi:beta-glucosidase